MLRPDLRKGAVPVSGRGQNRPTRVSPAGVVPTPGCTRRRGAAVLSQLVIVITNELNKVVDLVPLHLVELGLEPFAKTSVVVR